MNKVIRFTGLMFCLLVLALIQASCSAPKQTASTDRVHPIITYFQGEHALRKFVSDDSRPNLTTHSEGWWWFLVVGGGGKKDVAAGKQRLEDSNIVFYWQLYDGTYAISEMPLRDIRVRIDSTATTPTISFVPTTTSAKYFASEYTRGITLDGLTHDQAGDVVRIYADYAILTVREEDWPINIQLPLN